ncbi:hypothetical protein EDD15DRAFT_1087940 [Pisolithus albus]|nr:hypothetical protein EDD15DRAFT_1087940 [Pisolithus albus]
MEEYHAFSDASMATPLERLEDPLDELSNNNAEVDYHSGVLTLKLGLHGTYAINKQLIWLSSPIRPCCCYLRENGPLLSVILNSGPKRYDDVRTTDDWRYSRDGEELSTVMEHIIRSRFPTLQTSSVEVINTNKCHCDLIRGLSLHGFDKLRTPLKEQLFGRLTSRNSTCRALKAFKNCRKRMS